MAYYGSRPVRVVDGGTGSVTLTNHGVLLGQATSSLVAVTPGVDGELLVSTSGADSAFSNTSQSNFSFAVSSAGNIVSLDVRNSDNTNTASQAVSLVSTGGSSSGDPRHQYVLTTGGTFNWSFIVSNATTSPEADPIQLVTGTTAATNLRCVMQKSGLINFPVNSCFLSRLGSTVNNITGAGGTYTLGSGTALTEIFDQHADITTAGVYTAPMTAKTDLRTSIQVIGAASSKVFTLNLVTSNRTYQYLVNSASLSGNQTISISTIADMDAADTATVNCVVTGEVGDTDDILGGTTVTTFICGRQVA